MNVPKRSGWSTLNLCPYLGRDLLPTPELEWGFPRLVIHVQGLDRTSRMTPTVAPQTPTRHIILLDDKRWCHRWWVMYSTQTMVRAQIYMYISRPKYTRQSPDCPLVIFSHIALPLAHCSTSYSSASLAQYCVVAPHSLLVDSARLHYHRQHPSRVSPSDHTSLPVVRPLPAISSELQQHAPLIICHVKTTLSAYFWWLRVLSKRKRTWDRKSVV